MKHFLFILLSTLLLSCNSTSEDKIQAKVNLQNENHKELTKSQRVELVTEGKTSPIGTLIGLDSIPFLTDEFKGKLLIIDFWSTWCSPCIKETPKFKELGMKLGNRNTKFITISIDFDYTTWKDFILENEWGNNNFWHGSFEEQPFFSHLFSEVEIENSKNILVALPKYIAISPIGTILNNNLPKPSSPEFEKEITKLIKEHAT